MKLSNLTFIELLRMEHEPDLELRRAAFREVVFRWRARTPNPVAQGVNRTDAQFGIPWIGCDTEDRKAQDRYEDARHDADVDRRLEAQEWPQQEQDNPFILPSEQKTP